MESLLVFIRLCAKNHTCIILFRLLPRSDEIGRIQGGMAVDLFRLLNSLFYYTSGFQIFIIITHFNICIFYYNSVHTYKNVKLKQVIMK